ncbi:helix-turn-helix domain-containing protein [Halalkalibacterium halodurans]|uniref:helix-turn-helix domain-containing protein n=1 Tax=Halalkalibacterium halodurans TaxID=86665 RepID=UPI002E1E9A94|nr:helix-turn-helix domain-containing protein [Halalkalibacterium halodurans]
MPGKSKRTWLINIRTKKGLTQEEVSKISGIERSTYAKAELGNSVSVSTAKSISSALGFSWTYFFDGYCDDKGRNESDSA